MNFNKKLWEEFKRDVRKLNLSTLVPNDKLIPGIWDEKENFNPEVRQKLLKIAQDFFESLDLDVAIDDITVTGSGASYNWSKMSDIDLHILVDYRKVDENTDLVGDYFRGKIFVWNQKHDIEFFDHEVEIYVQDTEEPHHSLGVYSLMKDEWLTKPEKEDVKIDLKGVKKKATMLMDCIERIYDLFEDQKYRISLKCAEKMKDKIRKMRQTGLDDGGIYSVENLSFKVLRRNGYIGDLNEIINKSYDKINSLAQNFVKKLKMYVSEPKNQENEGFQRLQELEKFQKSLKRRHERQKRRLISHGNQENKPPYSTKPSYKRGKSAPPGFGGS